MTGELGQQKVHELGPRKAKRGIKISRYGIKSEPARGLKQREKSLTVPSIGTVEAASAAVQRAMNGRAAWGPTTMDLPCHSCFCLERASQLQRLEFGSYFERCDRNISARPDRANWLRTCERRLKIEVEHEAQLFGQGLIFFNLENWYAAPWIVRTALKLTGLYGRARRNADHVVVKKHSVAFANFPPAFHNFTILHISDLHADISVGAMRHLVSVVGGLQYDICVLTGDYPGPPRKLS